MTNRLFRAGLLALCALLGCGRGAAPPGVRVVAVERQDLVIDVEVAGSLTALESEQIGPPPIVIDTWQFKIIRMVPEGTKVKAGDEVIAFDASDLENKLKDRESDAESYSEELGKTRAESALSKMTDKLELQDAEAKRRKAELLAEKPPDVTAGLSLRASSIDRQLSQREVEFQIEREHSKRLQEASAVAILDARLQRARGRVAELKTEIEAMAIKAKHAGTVVYKQGWQGDKKKVGDNVWRGESALELTALEHMAVQGQVDEVDASHVALHQHVGLRLEAHPDREYSGEVERVATLVQTESPGSRVKVVQIVIKLAETDPVQMRPGMRVRGRIEIARLPGVAQVPLAAIESTASGPVVTRLDKHGGSERVPIRIGRHSREAVEVTAGLHPGDRVLVPLAGEGASGGGFRLGAS